MLRLLNFLYLDFDYGVALIQQGCVNILGTVSHSITSLHLHSLKINHSCIVIVGFLPCGLFWQPAC